MMGHKKIFSKSDRKINQRNKKLMIDKILSYNPVLIEGIEVYKDANRNFILLISLGVILVNFPLISVPCCILSMFFIIRMLQFIRYKSINNIVNKLAKDLSYKGIYDKGKAVDMLDDFRVKYGQDIAEYSELVSMLNKYEALVTKIENVLRNISIKEKNTLSDKEKTLNSEELSFDNNISIAEEIQEKLYKRKKPNDSEINDKLSVLYKNKDGELKRVNKAIEFFETENNESHNKENAVILKNVNKENKSMTVYLYKKSSDLQKNVL